MDISNLSLLRINYRTDTIDAYLLSVVLIVQSMVEPSVSFLLPVMFVQHTTIIIFVLCI